MQLIGKEMNEIQLVLKSIWPTLETSKEAKKFSDGAIFWSFKPFGLQFCFIPKDQQSIVDSIFVYNKQQGKPQNKESQQLFQKYNEQLPHGLSLNMNNVDIVKKFGEPTKKGGGGRGGPIWISYENLGFQIDFIGSSWDDLDNKISFITFFPQI